MSNLDVIYNYLIDQGFSRNAAYGVIGNIKAESGGDTGAVGDGGTSGGICQWHEGRWANLKRFAEERGKPWTNLQVQLDFLMHELRSGYPDLLNTLKTTTSMAEAARDFMVTFERPADTSPAAIQGRVNLADQARDAGVGGGERGDNDGSGQRDGGGGDGPKVRASDFGFDPEFLKQHPEIEKLVDRAVKGEWSETRFAAALKETRWWEKHSAAQRDWQMLQTEDPATAKDTLKDYERQIITMARQMGVELSNRDVNSLAERAAKNGWDTTEIQMKVGGQFRLAGKQEPEKGQAATVTTDLERMADEFAVPMSRQQKAKWTRNILQGEQTVEGYQDVLAERAKALYPHLSDAIDRAGSVRAWADAYLQQAANMLGISPDTMRLDRGAFAQLLAPTKDKQPMTMDQWERLLRTDEKFGWDKTNGAQAQASQLATQLAQRMGAI